MLIPARKLPSPLCKGWLLLPLAGLLLLAGCEHDQPKVYQSFRSSLYVAGTPDQVLAINAIDLSVQARLRVGGHPFAVAFNPARNELYVLNQTSHSISVIDTVHNKVDGEIHLQRRPTAITMSPNGAFAWVTAEDTRGRGQLLQIDLPARSVIGRLNIGDDPSALQANAAGDRLIIANRKDDSVSIIDGTTLRLLTTVSVGESPSQVLILPYGHKAFVLCPASNQVSIVDLQDGALLTHVLVGNNPVQMILKPDGGELYVSNFGSNNISVIDTTDNQVSSTLLAGKGPMGMAVTPDGKTLYVANSQSSTVTPIDLATRQVGMAIPVGRQPEALQLGPFGQNLFVEDVFSNDIGVVRTDLRTLLTLLPSAPHPTTMKVVWFRQPPH